MINAIEIKQLGKKYNIFHEKGALVRDIPLWFLGIKKYEELWALQDIDLEVNAGECLGIIGGNGAGKSTLLNILSGITFPTHGTVKLNGKISPILSLGAGFHPELTGEENIYLNASILGLSPAEIKGRFKEIVEFSGLKGFIDAPLRTYSTGMYMRLGFSVAMHTDFDIILIDEIISVGDIGFQEKCLNKLKDFRRMGKTIIIVSQSMELLRILCHRALLLDKGKINFIGKLSDAIGRYNGLMQKKIRGEREEAGSFISGFELGYIDSGTVASGNFKAFADLETKSIRLYFKEQEITRRFGLNSILNVLQDKFDLRDALWQIHKISKKELTLILDYPHMLSQIWTLIFEDQNTLKIKVEIETDKPIPLTRIDVGLELENKYKNWLTAYEEGDFLVNQCINNVGPIRLRNSKAPRVILKSENDNYLPRLFFESSSGVDRWILGIYKYQDANEECAGLNFSLVIPKKEELVNPGRYAYFEGKIILDKDIKLEEESALNEGIILCKGNLRFIFDQGRGRLFFGKKELTSGLGVYTSVRSLGIWCDSYQAAWQLEEKKGDQIIVSGDWPYIPISQTWQIKLIDEQSVFWKVEIKIHEESDLEIEQANLMLVPEYKVWIIPDVNKGEFINEYTQDYDISPFRFWYGKSDQIEIKTLDADLPPISFKCNQKDGCFKAIVENTDYLYRARLIQYQKGNNITKLSPKKYTYFEGVIKIGLKE